MTDAERFLIAVGVFFAVVGFATIVYGLLDMAIDRVGGKVDGPDMRLEKHDRLIMELRDWQVKQAQQIDRMDTEAKKSAIRTVWAERDPLPSKQVQALQALERIHHREISQLSAGYMAIGERLDRVEQRVGL